MERNVILVSEEDRNMVQRADIDCASAANLLSFMAANNIEMSSERFAEYEERYKQAFYEFTKAKQYIERKYAAPHNATSWSLDYETCEITLNA